MSPKIGATMVKFIFFLIVSSSIAYADFFSSGSTFKSKLPQLTEKIQSLQVKTDTLFEEKFTQLTKEAESVYIEEREYCAGDLADSKGRVVNKDQKQVCFRELKNNYLEVVDAIFNIKKKYLNSIHSDQIERLNQVQNKIKMDLEKSF